MRLLSFGETRATAVERPTGKGVTARDAGRLLLVKAPELPPTPEPSPPKRLGPLDWVRMIVLAVVFSIIGVIAWAVLLPQTELKAFFVLAVIPLGIATFVAGRIVGWHGEGKWIAAFVLNIVICSVIAIAAAAAFIASTPPGAFY